MLFAHQGGWDEVVMVALPIALFALLLWRANRRVSSRHEEEVERDG